MHYCSLTRPESTNIVVPHFYSLKCARSFIVSFNICNEEVPGSTRHVGAVLKTRPSLQTIIFPGKEFKLRDEWKWACGFNYVFKYLFTLETLRCMTKLKMISVKLKICSWFLTAYVSLTWFIFHFYGFYLLAFHMYEVTMATDFAFSSSFCTSAFLPESFSLVCGMDALDTFLRLLF